MIHQYQLNGYNIVLDVNSGAIHVVDGLTYDMIAEYKEREKDELIADMAAKHGVSKEEAAEETRRARERIRREREQAEEQIRREIVSVAAAMAAKAAAVRMDAALEDRLLDEALREMEAGAWKR